MSLMLHRAGLLRPSLAAPAPSAPAAFDTGNWSLIADDEEAHVTISSLPAHNGASITDIEYRLDGGAWVSSGGTGNFTITSLTNDQPYDVELRAVNSAGPGAASDTKRVTPGADGEETFEEAVIALLGAKLRAFWLYDTPAYLWQDTSATTAVTADTDPVGRVDDLSGNGKHLLQATSGNRPAYRTGPPRVVWDAVNDYLSISSAAFPIDELEAFQVVEQHTAAINRGLYSFGSSSGNDWNFADGMVMRIDTNNMPSWEGSSGLAVSKSGAGPFPLALYEFSKSANAAWINTNGALDVTDSSFTARTSPHSGPFVDGARVNSGVSLFAPIARRCTVMTAPLTMDERNDLRALINARYSLW